MMNSDSNIIFSKLNGNDLFELVNYIFNFCPILRNSLGLDNNDTFGCEIEFENLRNKELLGLNLSLSFPNWKFKDDLSLNNGAEVCSPCMHDTSSNWLDFSNVCGIVKNIASIGNNSGGHIHVGAQVFDGVPNNLIRFIKLWSVYENVIFRFSYGEYLSGREKINCYATPCSSKLWEDYLSISKVKDMDIYEILNVLSSYKRYWAVNFRNIKNIDLLLERNTVEFRCPNGTLNAIVWQNNVNFFVKLLECVKSNRYNDDIIDRRRVMNNGIYSNLNMYNEIYLEQALELSDMVFSSNIDKIYFLKQYLKSFEISNDCKKKVKDIIEK